MFVWNLCSGVFPYIGNKSPSFTEDGFEETFGINHLGHMYLTLLLLQLLKESTPSRIVMVSSELHDPNTKSGAKNRKPHIDFENLQLVEPNTFNSFLAYSNSKLANILFATELSSRLPRGTGVTINSVTPGWIPKTNLGNPGCCFHCFLVCCFHYCCRCCKITRTLEEGTDCIVKVATDPSLKDVTGKYYKDCKETESSDESRDARVARALWNESLNLLGLTGTSPVLLALKWESSKGFLWCGHHVYKWVVD